MKSIIVQRFKTFADSTDNSIEFLSVENVEVNLVIEQIVMTPDKTVTFKCTDEDWQNILKMNPNIHFRIL